MQYLLKPMLFAVITVLGAREQAFPQKIDVPVALYQLG
jgi:hypothetical protein